MFFRRKRARPTADAPDDAVLAQEMAKFADIFVRGSAEEGWIFDYTVEATQRLDPLVDLFLQGRPSRDVVGSMTLSMGAYLGEVLVRQGIGEWTFEPETEAPGVRLPSGLVCFPIAKVGKRIAVGPEHSITQFVEVARSGELPPNARQVRPAT